MPQFQSFMPRITTPMLRPFAAACLVAVASLGWTGWAVAASCSSTNYDLNTQAEVDALGATGCDSVSGDLRIENSSNITNVDGLANLISVGGNLYIASNSNLVDLDGLANLAEVGVSLGIYYNPSITNLDGLSNISAIGRDLGVGNNAALTNLDGLSKLTSINGFVDIEYHEALTNLDGLANITSVEGALKISNNDALPNIDGLASLTSFEGNLLITQNDALTNLNGLANLTSVGGDFLIQSNAVLTNLDALVNLTGVEGALSISGNSVLTNLDGLVNISTVEDYLVFNGNSALTNLDGLANLTSVGSYLTISGNSVLTNLDGLANLTSVGGGLGIQSNAGLTNLNGLTNLTRVEDYLIISSNGALTNLDGLANLTGVGGLLRIDHNYSASCEGVAQLLGFPDGPPEDTVAGDIDIGNNGSGCDSIEQVLASVSGPTKPTITSASAIGGGGISLEFSTSTTTDALFPITGYEAACIGSSADLSEAPSAALLDNTPVTRTLNVSGYDPVAVLSDIEVDIDITHSDPADLYITLTTPQGTELVLWDQGSSGSEDITGTFPTTLTPIDTISSVGRQAMDGNWVLRVEDVDVGPLVREGVLNAWGLRISETLTTAGSGSPITVNGVTRGRDYSCTVAPVTGLGTVPVSDAVTAKSDFPSTPTVTTTDYEDGTIRLTVSVADNGGADITEYSASCTDGTSTFTGTSSTPTIEVTGLTNGTAYTCSASATNAVGSSGASASTDSITPEALPTGLPIWLLYEATK